MQLWHGSKTPIEDFSVGSAAGRRELHLGTLDQAAMRNCAHLYLFEFDPGRIRRVKDNGEVGGATCDQARRAGFDSVVYLNRYEGMTLQRLQALADDGVLDKIDRFPDAKFKKHVPEAQDSYAVLNPESVTLIAQFEGVEAARAWLERQAVPEEELPSPF